VCSATKAAARSFARTWTTDLKHRRIRVNAISPGFIDTPGLRELLTSTETDRETRAKAWFLSAGSEHQTRLRRLSYFSPPTTSSYVTGVELFADGGFAQVSMCA
jgi:NAD(P)-dependent dehydrogenase (short-subunit alcohol dehydrogenase family)